MASKRTRLRDPCSSGCIIRLRVSADGSTIRYHAGHVINDQIGPGGLCLHRSIGWASACEGETSVAGQDGIWVPKCWTESMHVDATLSSVLCVRHYLGCMCRASSMHKGGYAESLTW